MSACEKCWADAGGDMARYTQLLQERADHPCTPEQQTGAVTDLCEDCNERPITGLDALCDVCRNNANERAYQRDMEEPTYRGGEYAASVAHEMAEARKLK